MGWFDWLRKVPAPVIDHPRFGRVRAAYRPASGPWLWETLDLVPTARGEADVGFDAPETGPTSDQERQFDWILANLDPLTMAAAPMIAAELKNWPVIFSPDDPWAELEWHGAHLTDNSSPEGDWQIAYGCKSWPDAMITIYFEAGRPSSSRLDD